MPALNTAKIYTQQLEGCTAFLLLFTSYTSEDGTEYMGSVETVDRERAMMLCAVWTGTNWEAIKTMRALLTHYDGGDWVPGDGDGWNVPIPRGDIWAHRASLSNVITDQHAKIWECIN